MAGQNFRRLGLTTPATASPRARAGRPRTGSATFGDVGERATGPPRTGNQAATGAQARADRQGPGEGAGYRAADRFGWTGGDPGSPRTGRAANGWLERLFSGLALLTGPLIGDCRGMFHYTFA